MDRVGVTLSLAPSQLEGQVNTLSQEVTQLQGQCKQDSSSQAKVWMLQALGRRHSPLDSPP